MSKQCSGIFEEVFDSHCGGIVRTCACGITYFNGNEPHFFDEGEFEEYQANAKKEPEKWVEWDQSIGTMEINGNEIVYGCSCDRAERYEKFILSHRHQIADYLNKYIEGLKKDIAGSEVKAEPIEKEKESA